MPLSSISQSSSFILEGFFSLPNKAFFKAACIKMAIIRTCQRLKLTLFPSNFPSPNYILNTPKLEKNYEDTFLTMLCTMVYELDSTSFLDFSTLCPTSYSALYLCTRYPQFWYSPQSGQTTIFIMLLPSPLLDRGSQSNSHLDSKFR